MNLPASQIKPRDVIILDCGYGGETFCDKNCKVSSIKEVKALFSDDKLISFEVEIQDYTRERFDTYGFKPSDLINVFSIYKPKQNE